MGKVQDKTTPPPENTPAPQPPAQSSSTPPCCRPSLCSPKTLLIPIVLAVLAVALGVGYLVGIKILSPKIPPPVSPQITPYPTQAPEVTANWETYTYKNNKDSLGFFGYSIKYPPEWKSSTLKDTGADFGTLDLLSSGGDLIHISAMPLSENGFTLLDIMDNDKSGLNNIKQEEIMLPFSKAIRVAGIMNDLNRPDDIGKLWQVVYLENNNIVYRLFLFQSSNEDYSKTFDQILSTFRFLPASPASLNRGEPAGRDREQSDESVIRNLVETTWRSKLRMAQDQNLTISQVKIDEDYATIDAYLVYGSTGQPVPTGGILILAHKVNENWSLAFGGTDLYNTWLDAIPSTLIQPDIKPLLR